MIVGGQPTGKYEENHGGYPVEILINYYYCSHFFQLLFHIDNNNILYVYRIRI